MLEPAEGEGLEDGGGRTPTRDTTELRALARTAAFLPMATVSTSAVLSVGGQRRPAEALDKGPAAALASPARAPLPGSQPGSTCARPYWIHCPSHCLRAGAAVKEKARAEPGFSPSPAGVREPNLPAGNSGRTPGKITTPKGSPPSPQPAPAPSLPDTHPRALTPRKHPGGPRWPQPSWPRRRRREGGHRSGRAGGRREAAEGAEGKEGGGKMELGPYLSTDCSFSSSFFCRSMTARMIFLSSSVRWLRSGISGCSGG